MKTKGINLIVFLALFLHDANGGDNQLKRTASNDASNQALKVQKTLSNTEINCLAERQPLMTQTEFDKKYDINLQGKPSVEVGKQGDVYFGKCKKENAIHDLKGNIIEEVVLKVGKLNNKNELQNVTKEVKYHDYLLDGKIDMEFGVLPVLDIVDFVEEKTKKRILGFVMAKTDENLLNSVSKKPITLAELNKKAKAGFRTLKHMGMKGIAHRDLKTDNMAPGFGKWSHILHVLDFGNAVKYLPDADSNEPITSISGNKAFKSVAVLRGLHRQGPADDMYSFCEILLEVICGQSLPWIRLDDQNIIAQLKQKFNSAQKMIAIIKKREYVLQLLKDEKSEKTEEQFYAMFNKCYAHAIKLSTTHQEPKEEWYDEAAKFFE